MSLQLCEANQSVGIFIPESEVDGSHTGNKGDWFDGLKEGTGLMALLQVVIGNFRTEVVNVVKSNVPGKPLKDPGEFQERASFQGHLFVVPLFLPGPDYIFKLMLYIE